jgi:invasion protein IalB
MQRAVLIVALVALSGPALAQRSRAQTAPAPPPAAAPAPAPPAAPANEPQRTTATFGDWTLRCVRAEHAPVQFEVDQVLANEGRPVAKTAFGRPRAGEPMLLSIIVPPNISLASQPRLAGADSENGFAPIFLTWRRCVPQGCVADAALTDDQLRRLRSRSENARILFEDSAGHEASLPFGPHGLAQALDALAKES